MQRMTNHHNVPLSIAVFLAYDDYDYIDDPDYISATTFIQSERQITLKRRLGIKEKPLEDVSGGIARALGSAIHGRIEDIWTDKAKRDKALAILGYPQKIIDRVVINKMPDELEKGDIPVYLELRQFRKIGKYTIGGKFDFVGEGKLEDFKTTKTYSYTSGSNEEKYRLQGSLYRWLNPDIIKFDDMTIQFIFKDWNKRDASYKPGYPLTEIFPHKIRMKSLAETELWVQEKAARLEALEIVDEKDLPLCTSEDLWQEPTIYKYYKNPDKQTKSTKNFETAAEANNRWIMDGQVGVIEQVPGQVKACIYCEANSICSQYKDMVSQGLIT